MKHLFEELARIVEAVSRCNSQAAQVNVIVESISRYMAVDVCSLYIADDKRNMQLVASHGLSRAAVGKVSLPHGQGLVGLVAKTARPLNIMEPTSHPAYVYLKETREENFHSFCGVPLARGENVIGVLTVQSMQARKLDEKEETFLMTLAAQLVLIATSQTIPAFTDSITNMRMAGLRTSPGITIGIIHLCETEELLNVVDASCENIEETLTEWLNVLDLVNNEVTFEQRLFDGQLSENMLGIFGAYQMLLSDPSLIEGVKSLIRKGNWLPGALRQTIQEHANLFLAMDDPYLRARHEDIIHLGNKLYRAWKGTGMHQKYPEDAIILAGREVSVSEVARVPPGKLAGIVCFEGSNYSHTAILANALCIPAVMGIGEMMAIHNGDTLIVDGYQGQIILQPDKAVTSEFLALANKDQELDRQLEDLASKPAITRDQRPIQLLTNTGLLADITPGLTKGAEGVGLYRSEMPFMVNDNFPSEEQQTTIYRQVLMAYEGKPVYMRTLDIGGDKQLPYFPIRHEDNPALGWRGIRFGLDNDLILSTQLIAMLRANEGLGNLHIMLPMVSTGQELDRVHSILATVACQLRAEGLASPLPPLGITLEVPSAISQLHFWKDKIDFVSIGSNDLSQYLLAVDRNNTRVSAYFNNTSPAVLFEIKRIVSICLELDIPVSICGEMASDPVAAILLIGMGMDSLSVNASRLPRIKSLIRQITYDRARELLDIVLTMDNADAIRQLVEQELHEHGLEQLIT